MGTALDPRQRIRIRSRRRQARYGLAFTSQLWPAGDQKLPVPEPPARITLTPHEQPGPSARCAPSRRAARPGSPAPFRVNCPADPGRRAEPRRVSHSPRVALGSGTVSVLLFPACGIFTRFHGSCRAAAAMLRGAGEPGKTEPGETGWSGLGGEREGGSAGAGRGVLPGAGLRRVGTPAKGVFKFLPGLEQLRS